MGRFTDEPRIAEVDDPDLDGLGIGDVAHYFAPGIETAQRLHVDELFHQHFREHGLTGAVSDYLVHQLLAYGLGFVTTHVESGWLFARTSRHGWGVPRQAVSHADAQDLSSDVVMDGLQLFHDQGVVAGGWSPHLGVPLKGYFINACVLQFPNCYRKWQRRRRDWQEVKLLDAWSTVDQFHASHSAEDTVVAQAVVDSLFEHIKSSDRALLSLVRSGYTPAEIGDLMRLRPDTVSMRISRARGAARRYLDREGEL
jgi:RNA polymerase sigma-70 factor (ECF subfamily)